MTLAVQSWRINHRSAVSLILVVLWIAACDSPQYPELCGSIPEQTIVVGETVTVDLCFDDPDGEMLSFEVFSSDPGVGTAVATGSTVTVTAISPGVVLVTMVATDPTGLKAQQSFRVVVPNRPPAAVGTIDDRELMVGDSAVINVAGHFSEPDGQVLSHAAAVTDSSRLTASVEGAVVSLVAVAKGTVVVTVTATDPGGLTATQSFEVKVPNRPPVPVDSIAAREIMADRSDTLDVSPFFSDPDEDPLTYVAAVSDSAVVAATVSDSTVTVTGLAKGEAVVTITATDDEGLSATQRFMVTVPNRPPVVTDTIPAQTLFKDEADTLKLAAHFTDPDGDPLTWRAEASDSTVVALGLSATDGTLIVAAVSQGEAVVTVTATDTEGLNAQQSFAVTVPNRAPVATETIPAHVLHKREMAALDLTRYFSDPDGDVLEYEIESTDTLVATAAVTGATLTVQAGVKGEATLTVTATDPGGLAIRRSFAATVLNRAPIVTTPIPEQTIYLAPPHTVDVSAHFDDPDGDTLSYSAESSDRRVVQVQISGSSILLTAQRKGTADVTVTATDPDSLNAQQSFAVTVPNRAPVATETIPAHVLHKRETAALDLTRYFSDPDGDVLEYEIESTDTLVATAAVTGATLTVQAGVKGEATLTVTATDTEGLNAQQSFAVTVPNRAPVATETIPAHVLHKRETAALDLTRYFSDPDGDVLEYEIESTDTLVATAAVTGATLTVQAGVKGEATLTVTATDPGGLAIRRSFAATVLNRAPIVTTPIPEQTIYLAPPHTVDVSAHFDDPDGDTLSYSAESSDRRVVQVQISGSSILLTAQRKGTADVTVTATDPDSVTVQHTFAVIVGNQGPLPVGQFPDLALAPGDRLTLPISRYFGDPDGDALEYTASTSEPGIATATARGSDVTLTGVSDGQTTLTLTATDPDGLTATQTSLVTVAGQGGNTPEPVEDIPAQTISEGGDRTLVVSGYFQDPNGDPLAYSAATEDPGVATASVSGTIVTLRGVASGQTTLTVTATDPGGLSTTLSTLVTVVIQGQGPVAVEPIPEQSLEVGQTRTLSVADNFQDPDGGSLDFAAVSSDPGIVTAAASGSDVSLTGVSEGRTTVTVTATDPDGLSASQTASVRVEPKGQAPVTVGDLPGQSLVAGGFAIFDAAPYFRDPEGADLSYDAGTSDATVATASATGSTVNVRGVSAGKTTLTVTATDPSRLSATQSAEVDVSTPPVNGGQPRTEVHIFRPESVEENIGEVPLFVLAWTTENRAPTESIPVRVWLVSGTADEGVDFESLTQSIEFSPADFTFQNSVYEAAKQLTITIVNDSEAEDDETFGATMMLEHARPFVTLVSPNYPDQLIITILANDQPRQGR